METLKVGIIRWIDKLKLEGCRMMGNLFFDYLARTIDQNLEFELNVVDGENYHG